MEESERIQHISALKRQPDNEKAQQILVKIYRFALPMMKKYNYKVNQLVEFFPKNPNLLGLNVNRGQKICIRLRPANNNKEFYNFESVLHTMLHELTHNTYGPHDQKFFAHLDKMSKELDTMTIRGFQGDQFLGKGRTIGRGLGLPPLKSVPPASQVNRVVKGQKLGGSRNPAHKKLPLREILAQAAEQRRQADLMCKIVDLTESDSESEDELIEVPNEKTDVKSEFIDLT